MHFIMTLTYGPHDLLFTHSDVIDLHHAATRADYYQAALKRTLDALASKRSYVSSSKTAVTFFQLESNSIR